MHTPFLLSHSPLAAILLACLWGGLFSVLLAGFVAYRLPPTICRLLLPFAAGVMLSSACLDILPEALECFEQSNPADHGQAARQLFSTLLVGLLLFFALERWALWHHAHPPEAGAEPSAQSAAVLILIGDGLHNFVDGILLAAAFLQDPGLGLSTTLAIMAHEIPQELGDFAVLINAGWKKSSALLANGLCSLSTLVGGLLAYFFLQHTQASQTQAQVLTIAAASFLYIAIADLLPMLQRSSPHRFLPQSIGISLGLGTVPFVAWLSSSLSR